MDTQRLHRRFDIVVSAPRVFLRALARYDWRFLEIGRRFMLALRQRYLPEEAFEVGLLNPSTPLETTKTFVSRSEMVSIQRRLNPQAWEPVLSDKGIFYRMCLSAGIPVPELYALFFVDVAGWTASGKSPQKSDEWEEFFLKECPSEFLVKPSQAAYGSGIMIVSRRDGRFFNHGGESWDARGFVGRLRGDARYSLFVIQEKLHNHSSLAHLGCGEGVHSFRVVTYVSSQGCAEVVAADMKLIVGDNVISNLDHGLHGNLIADIDRENGSFKTALVMDARMGGYRSVTHHPDSGVNLENFLIPCWSDITALALRAAKFFRPVRTVGWDIALSTRGPCIMEGNIWYDPSLTGYVSDYWAVGYKTSDL